MRSARTLIGHEVRHVPVTASTMNDVARLAREGAREGIVVSADSQTAGRGRHQRVWESVPGEDVLASILFRPRPAVAIEINMLLALCVAELVEDSCGAATQLKWPNDVRASGAKVAGILLESVQDSGGLSVVAGIGLNVNSPMREANPGGIPAVSMAELAGRRFKPAQVLEDLLDRADSLYRDVGSGGTVVPAWKERLETIGREVRVTFASGNGDQRVLTGLAEDVDASGRLIVRDENGRAWPVSAGEVTLRAR